MGKKRFFDDRLKYLSFIQNTSEKKAISFKKIETECYSPSEIAMKLKEQIPFVEEQEILKHINRLINLKLITAEAISKKNESPQNKNLYSLKVFFQKLFYLNICNLA